MKVQNEFWADTISDKFKNDILLLIAHFLALGTKLC